MLGGGEGERDGHVRTDIDMHAIAHGGYTNTVKRVCTESWFWEKYPLPPRAIEPELIDPSCCHNDDCNLGSLIFRFFPISRKGLFLKC